MHSFVLVGARNLFARLSRHLGIQNFKLYVGFVNFAQRIDHHVAGEYYVQLAKPHHLGVVQAHRILHSAPRFPAEDDPKTIGTRVEILISN